MRTFVKVDVGPARDLAYVPKSDPTHIVAHRRVIASGNDHQNIWCDAQNLGQGFAMEMVFVRVRDVDGVQSAQVEPLRDRYRVGVPLAAIRGT